MNDKNGTAINYVVMTYARCGATYLSQLLGSTGSLGRPEDWFNGTGYRNRGIDGYPLDRAGQIEMMRTAGRSANGVCAVKLSPRRFDELSGVDLFAIFDSPRFVHLTRADRLARAISEVRAEQTGKWRSTSVQRAAPRYDARAIRAAIRRQALGEARLRQYFAWNDIAPLEVTFEELTHDADLTVNRIARFLAVDPVGSIDRKQVTLEVQRDTINDEWRDRFLQEHRNPGRLPPLDRSFRFWRGLGR